ncbi:MAG: hypothetical protein ACE5H0_13520, partial [Bacteroidota bacterium]
MKTRITKLIIAILIAAVWSRVHAENRLSFSALESSYRVASTGNKVSLVLQNSDAIKAIQLKTVTNAPGVTLKEVQRVERTLNQGWTVQYHSISEGHMNVLITNFGTDLFEAGEGAVAEVVFDLNESVTGEFFTLGVEEIKAADPQGRPVELLFGDGVTLAVSNEVNVEFIVNPLVVSLSITNRSEIRELRFEAELEGATVVAQPALKGRAEGMHLQIEQFSDRVAVVLENAHGISIVPGDGEILDIPIQSTGDVRLVVQEMSLLGTENTALVSLLSVVESEQQPQMFVLHQNYPNPFNPS